MVDILTNSGQKIDITPWLETMKNNFSRGRHIFENTPVGSKKDGNYFWWDEDENPELNKESVKRLIKSVSVE